jgi:uncharacterized protein (DUF1800 family)
MKSLSLRRLAPLVSLMVLPAAHTLAATTAADAARLAQQATFGPTESSIAEIRAAGAAQWVKSQMSLKASRYTLGKGDAIHQQTVNTSFCALPGNAGTPCWRDWYTSTPLLWDFYRNATQQPDQLRQRVAFALQQIVVVSELEVTGTYGFREYHNMLLDSALGNYRQVLKKVALSPLMGAYLDNVNNDKAAPNENFGRELLQLFSLGTCLLNPDASLVGGSCRPTYDNDTVRSYAYALTGWTYPAGGTAPWPCAPWGSNCPYFAGDMAALPQRHDTAERRLLSGVTVPAGSSAAQALELVLDSLMSHPNVAPFIGRQLIQHLVSSNPSAAYVQRVAAAFVAGRHACGATAFGSGQRGDLAATVAAVLLDPEARTTTPARQAGKLREPVLAMTGVLRALNGRTDGDALSYQWGDALRQHLFRAPSVFNYFPPDYPVPGSASAGPAFGIHNANTALERLNYLTYLLYWNGSPANASVPGAVGTRVDLLAFTADAADAGKLVDRLSLLALGQALPAAVRGEIVAAVETYTAASHPASWPTERVRQAAFLVFASPDYQIQR